MSRFERRGMGIVLVVVLQCVLTPAALADPPTLSIYDIQHTTTDGDASYYDYANFGELVHCTGGVVVANIVRSVPRLVLQDPAYPDGWGAIQVKDRYAAGAFNGIAVGAWVSLTNMEVEEVSGTTFLQWYPWNSPGMDVTTSGVPPAPDPIIVPVSAIPAPIEYPGDEWYVENHDAEPYECMRLIVRDVSITAMGLGKASDNYNLQDPAEEDCWAADYLNEDKPVLEDYHPFIDPGGQEDFCAITGLLEQYTNLGTGYDYYQLITLWTEDLAICGDGDSDGDVDLGDMPRFVECMTGPVCDSEPEGCDPPAWTETPYGLAIQHCLMMDLDYDGDVDLHDFAGLQGLLGS